MGFVADVVGRVAALLQGIDGQVLEESAQPTRLAKVPELRAK